MKIYLATSLDLARWVDTHVAEQLRARGHEVVSTWHRYPYPTRADESVLTPSGAHRIRERNRSELHSADAVIVIAQDHLGEHAVEAGWAVDAGKLTVWTGSRTILTAMMPGVVRVGSVAEAIDAVGGYDGGA